MAVNKSSLKLKTILIDLSGTLHIENEITPGATDSLKKLRQTYLNIKFVTNTTKESRRILYDRLRNLGFELKVEELFTTPWAARTLLEKENLRPMLLVDDDTMEDFSGLTNFEGNPNAVVVGLAPNKFNRSLLNDAFRILINGGRLIALHEGRFYKRKDGLALGPGAIVKCLEYGAGIKSLIVGKPNEVFFRAGLGNFLPEEAAMVGDDVQDDINGAQKIGIRGYLVKTGKYRNGDENKIDPRPYKCVDNFSAAVEDIISTIS